MILQISKASGIGQHTISTILSEYKNQGTVTTPNKNKTRANILEKVDYFDKKYIVFGQIEKFLRF